MKATPGRDFLLIDTDYPIVLDVLTSVLSATGYGLCAFCLVPREAHLVLRMSHIPLADFLQRLALKIAHRVKRSAGLSAAALVDAPTPPRLFDDNDRIRELIRFVHLLPVKFGADPAQYAWSGHRTYLGTARMPAVDARIGLKLFDRDPHSAREEYRIHMDRGLAAIRERQYGALPLPRAGQEATISSLPKLLEAVAGQAQRSTNDILSDTHERYHAFLRAFISWTATELHLATMTEVARFLRRDVSTLRAAITRYKTLFPTVFEKPGDVNALKSVNVEAINKRLGKILASASNDASA